jgi:chromosome segregation ATPase
MPTSRARNPKSRSKRTAKPTDFRWVPKDRDLPATQGMLYWVRKELKDEMKAGFLRMESRFEQIDSRFKQVDARFAQIDSRFEQIDSRFSQVDARFNQMESQFHDLHSSIREIAGAVASLSATVARMEISMEEQNARNRIVMESQSGLWARQERLETRVDGFETWIKSLSKPQ